VLDLHGNRLTGAPPDHLLYYVHALLSLNVSNNRLTSAHLGPGFRYVTQLADIDLSGTWSVTPTFRADCKNAAQQLSLL